MGADLTGAYGLPIDPAVASTLTVEEVNRITQADWGPSPEESAAIIAEADAIRAEEERLRQFLANQEQARWAEEQIAAQNETTFTEDLAQAYVDFIEGDSTTAEFLTDPIGVTTEGTIGVVTDVVGTDVITGSIGAVGDVIAPITEPVGENLGKLIVPAAILGGAYLLLK